MISKEIKIRNWVRVFSLTYFCIFYRFKVSFLLPPRWAQGLDLHPFRFIPLSSASSLSSSPLSSLYVPLRNQWKQCQTLSFWAPKSLQMVTAAMKLKDAYSLEGKL